MPPKLHRVFRLDSLPLNRASYTTEGYLVDRPVVTTIGIFEYQNPDGSVRRELRLPEDVFDPESLKSYRGKPIIVTHDAGLITKDNVGKEEIGTILSDGYRDGDNVKAEIIIHDTDAMKSAGLKELSLGYNLDLDETPGEWNGQPYDAIQRNIRINHLALVREARAGEQARLNIDSRDKISHRKEQQHMSKTKKISHGDGVLSPEELEKAIEEYKARRAQDLSEKKEDGDDAAENTGVESTEPAVPNADGDEEGTIEITEVDEDDTTEAKVAEVKANRDRRDEEGEPKDKEAAMGVIAQQDEDLGILFDIIDTLLAERDFGDTKPAKKDGDDEECTGADCNADCGASSSSNKDGEEPGEPEDAENEDEDEEPAPDNGGVMNADSVDRIVRQRIQLGMIGQKLNMDGLENMGIVAAKKAIIHAVRPTIRLDGKSTAYIDAAFDLARSEVEQRTVKDTSFQKRQMFNADSRKPAGCETSSMAARQRMIDRMSKKKEEK